MNLLKVLVLILLIFIPLYPKFPLTGVEGTYVAVRVDDIVVASVFLVWLLFQLRNRLPVLRDRLFRLFALYWLAGLIANLSAFAVTDLVSFKLATLHWLRRIEYMSLFFVVKDAIKKRIDLNELIAAIWLALAGVFVYGMGQKYWGWPVISTMNEEFSKGILLYLSQWTRISSTFAGHYDLAAWLAMILSLSPAVFLLSKKKWQRILIFVFSLLGFYLLVLTASRISFVAYLIGITATLGLLRKYWWVIPVVGFSLFFGFQSRELNARLAASLNWRSIANNRVIAFLRTVGERRGGVSTPTPTPVVQKPTPSSVKKGSKGTTSSGSPGSTNLTPTPKKRKEVRTWPTPEEAEVAAVRSSNIRFKVEWPRAIRAFLKNPLLGTGYSSLGLATDNDYLRLLGETGLLGLLAFLLIIFRLLKEFCLTVFRRRGEWQLAAGFTGAMIGFLANAIFIDVFEASKVAFYFWMLMGIGYRLTRLRVCELRVAGLRGKRTRNALTRNRVTKDTRKQ